MSILVYLLLLLIGIILFVQYAAVACMKLGDVMGISHNFRTKKQFLFMLIPIVPTVYAGYMLYKDAIVKMVEWWDSL